MLSEDNNLILYASSTNKALILLESKVSDVTVTSISKEQCIFLDLGDDEIIGIFKSYIIVTDHKSYIKLLDICSPQEVFY